MRISVTALPSTPTTLPGVYKIHVYFQLVVLLTHPQSSVSVSSKITFTPRLLNIYYHIVCSGVSVFPARYHCQVIYVQQLLSIFCLPVPPQKKTIGDVRDLMLLHCPRVCCSSPCGVECSCCRTFSLLYMEGIVLSCTEVRVFRQSCCVYFVHGPSR